MNPQKTLSIMEFSKLTGIKKENLRFYDRIGLLSPEMRGENNYRYYSRHQLGTAYLIASLRWIGVGIEEIKKYSTQRTPEKSLTLLAQQNARIQAEIERLKETQRIMKMYSDMIQEALAYDENVPFLEKKEQEPIFLCPSIPPHMDEDAGEVFSYEYADARGVHLSYPLGVRISQHCLETGDSTTALQYYFKTQENSNAEKPKGLYAIIYGCYNPWDTKKLYLQLLNFIHSNGLEICGDAFEEYLLSDISVQTPDCYGIRIEISVTKSTNYETDRP